MSTWAIFWICLFGASVLKTLIRCLFFYFKKPKPVVVLATPVAGNDFDVDAKAKKTKKSKATKAPTEVKEEVKD